MQATRTEELKDRCSVKTMNAVAAELAKAAEAYGRMMRNEARFRIVLVTGE
jgi:hypothetical protein